MINYIFNQVSKVNLYVLDKIILNNVYARVNHKTRLHTI